MMKENSRQLSFFVLFLLLILFLPTNIMAQTGNTLESLAGSPIQKVVVFIVKFLAVGIALSAITIQLIQLLFNHTELGVVISKIIISVVICGFAFFAPDILELLFGVDNFF